MVKNFSNDTSYDIKIKKDECILKIGDNAVIHVTKNLTYNGEKCMAVHVETNYSTYERYLKNSTKKYFENRSVIVKADDKKLYVDYKMKSVEKLKKKFNLQKETLSSQTLENLSKILKHYFLVNENYEIIEEIIVNLDEYILHPEGVFIAKASFYNANINSSNEIMFSIGITTCGMIVQKSNIFTFNYTQDSVFEDDNFGFC